MKAIVIVHESGRGCEIFDTDTGILYSIGIGEGTPYATIDKVRCAYQGAYAISFARQLVDMLDQESWYTAEVRALILDMEDSLREEILSCTKS